MSKKSYILILSIFCLSIFSYISINMLKNINFSNQNKTKYFLYLQAKIHLKFLEEYLNNTNLNNINNIKIENEHYNIYANIINNKINLHVKHKNYKISLFKKIDIK